MKYFNSFSLTGVFDCEKVRRGGHMTLTRPEWAGLMLGHSRHLVLSTAVRLAELGGVFHPHHVLYRYLVYILDTIKIL